MPTYQYRCDNDGLTEVNHAMGTAPAQTPCPSCRQPARRVFTTPLLSRGNQVARRLIEASEATSDHPDVVTAIPSANPRPGRRGLAPSNPLLHKLPRP